MYGANDRRTVHGNKKNHRLWSVTQLGKMSDKREKWTNGGGHERGGARMI